MELEALFADVAGVYDRMNRMLSLGRDRVWRALAAGEAGGEPRRVLDLACGTGELTAALAARFPSAEITGLDLTPAMLELARRKDVPGRIRFVAGDAQNLGPIGAFDLVTCAFGFRNFPDKRAALAEAARVAPGGELLVLEFFRPKSRLLGLITAGWLRLVLALFARGHAAAYAHLRESIASTLTEGEFVALAKDAGFRLVRRRFFLPCCTLLHLAGGGL